MNFFWNGTLKAHIGLNQIDRDLDWGSGDHCVNNMNFVNAVFKFWYIARQNINSITDTTLINDTTHKEAMTTTLEDAGQHWSLWYPSGISNLEKSFEYMIRNSGNWTDDDTRSYGSQPNSCFQPDMALTHAPRGIVAFANAIDDKYEDLIEILREFERNYNSLDFEYLQPPRSRNWAIIGTILGQIKDNAERAAPFLWMTPNTQEYATGTVTFANALSRVHTGLTTYTNSLESRLPERVSAGIAALAVAVTYVPVFGAFYGKAVELIPVLSRWFRGIMHIHTRGIGRASSNAPYGTQVLNTRY